MGQELNSTYEDEIDLRVLWRTIMKSKILIITMTSLITIGAIVYAFTLPKVYEVSAMVQVGRFGSNTLIENPATLAQRIKVLFHVGGKKIVKLPVLETVDVLKDVKDIIQVVTLGFDNASAKKKLADVIKFIETEHKEKIEQFIQLTKKSINNNELRLAQMSKEKEGLEKQLKTLGSNIAKLKNVDIAFTSLYQMQLNEMSDRLSKVQFDALAAKEKIDALNYTMSDVNIHYTKMIGEIEESNFPINPKKKLIVIVAFATGLILSIFLVFFLGFIRSVKESEHEINAKTQH